MRRGEGRGKRKARPADAGPLLIRRISATGTPGSVLERLARVVDFRHLALAMAVDGLDVGLPGPGATAIAAVQRDVRCRHGRGAFLACAERLPAQEARQRPGVGPGATAASARPGATPAGAGANGPATLPGQGFADSTTRHVQRHAVLARQVPGQPVDGLGPGLVVQVVDVLLAASVVDGGQGEWSRGS
ncbi:MAG: hypothetical protein KatS3mg051_1202 [Anaerolineae bacterium]|nr:MAG: hypothetical protein KatS3mg051_1202 [Anaerolineae bacterium]